MTQYLTTLRGHVFETLDPTSVEYNELGQTYDWMWLRSGNGGRFVFTFNDEGNSIELPVGALIVRPISKLVITGKFFQSGVWWQASYQLVLGTGEPPDLTARKLPTFGPVGVTSNVVTLAPGAVLSINADDRNPVWEVWVDGEAVWLTIDHIPTASGPGGELLPPNRPLRLDCGSFYQFYNDGRAPCRFSCIGKEF